MTYFVYIESRATSVPHMEPLDADCRTSAAIEAAKHLQTHTNGTAAHVYDGDVCIASVVFEDP